MSVPPPPEARPPVVVTGGSQGIGAAIVRELDARGFRVWALSRSGSAPAGEGVRCDVTDEGALRETLAAIAGEEGLCALVANAGVHRTAPSERIPRALWEEVMGLNATAVMLCAREAFPHLRRAGGGSLVLMGSFFDRLGVPHNLAYCASKAAVGAMARCLAVEWARHGIRVVNVAPGYVATALNRDYLGRDSVRSWMRERVPLGRPGTPEEVARLVGALLVEDIPYLTGETIYMDGGHSINH